MMQGTRSRIRVSRTAGIAILFLAAACAPAAPPAPVATTPPKPAEAAKPTAAAAAPTAAAKAGAAPTAAAPAGAALGALGTGSGKVYYADARTWPSHGEQLKPFAKGKFYIPVQDDGLVVVVDPEKPDYIVKSIKIDAAQPHHPWTAPGMRYMYINHQSEAKGDHNVMTVIDTFTDEVVKEIKTDFDDPFHCSWNSVRSDLLLCGDLNPNGGWVYYLDTANHEFLKKVKTSGTQARDVIQTQDGKFAFIGHQGKGDVDVLDVAEGKIVKTIVCDRCARLKMAPDGKSLFASSPPTETTAIIDAEKQEIVKKIEFPKGSGPGNINFGAGGKTAMIGLGAGGKLALVDVATRELGKVLDSGKSTNTAYANPIAPNIAIATNDGTDDWYTVVDVAEGRVIEKIDAGGKATHNVQWSPDGRFAVGSDRLGDTLTIFRWNDASKKVERIASPRVGFGTNGVQWAPYFCGVPHLTLENLKTAKNAPATNAKGDCG